VVTQKQVFTLQIRTIGKPAGVEAIDVADYSIDEAIKTARELHGPSVDIFLIQKKSQLVYVRS
jgi:hypothetical protein